MHAGESGFRLCDSLNIKLTIRLVGAGLSSVSCSVGVQLVVFVCSSVSVVLLTPKGSPCVSTRCFCLVPILASSSLFVDLIVALEDTLMS